MIPVDFRTEAVVRVPCEANLPSEHPKLINGINKIIKSYPLADLKVEESGEHVIIGTGEL